MSTNFYAANGMHLGKSFGLDGGKVGFYVAVPVPQVVDFDSYKEWVERWAYYVEDEYGERIPTKEFLNRVQLTERHFACEGGSVDKDGYCLIHDDFC